MSGFFKVENSTADRTDLKWDEKFILLILLRFKNKNGIAYPSQERLSIMSGLSKRTVIRALKSLVEKHIIQKENTKVKTNTYSFIPVPHSHRCPTVTSDSQSPDQCPTVTIPVTHSHPIKTITKTNIKTKKTREKKVELELPKWLNQNVWQEWVTYKKERNQPLPPSTVRYQISRLVEYGIEKHIAIIRQSIERGYTGLFNIDSVIAKNANTQKPANFIAAPEDKYERFDK